MLFARNLSNKYGKKILNTATKTGLYALKTTSRKVVHKAAEGTGGFKRKNLLTKLGNQNLCLLKRCFHQKRGKKYWLNYDKYYKMELFKISKLFNDSAALTFMTTKWIDVKDLLRCQYSVNKSIRFKTPMVRSDFCDFSDAYFVVKGTITVEGTTDVNKINKKLTSKNNARLVHACQKLITNS